MQNPALIEMATDGDRMKVIASIFGQLSSANKTVLLEKLQTTAISRVETLYQFLVVGGPFKEFITGANEQQLAFQRSIAMALGDDRQIVYVDGWHNEVALDHIADTNDYRFVEHPHREEVQKQVRELDFSGVCIDLESRYEDGQWIRNYCDTSDVIPAHLDALNDMLNRIEGPRSKELWRTLTTMSRGHRTQKTFNISVNGQTKRVIYVEPAEVSAVKAARIMASKIVFDQTEE
jgi:hypothetical protein